MKSAPAVHKTVTMRANNETTAAGTTYSQMKTKEAFALFGASLQDCFICSKVPLPLFPAVIVFLVMPQHRLTRTFYASPLRLKPVDKP